jgi:uncharacterized protein YjlB
MAQAKGYGDVRGYNAPLGTDTFVFQDDGFTPNSRLPLIVRRGAIQPSAPDPAKAFESTFAKNGWVPDWRDTVFDYNHFHSTAHEAIGVFSGSATIRFGGERGEIVPVSAGDVVIIPAGVGHARIKASDDFMAVGAYADGRSYDILRDDAGGLPAARQRIGQVPLPAMDPVDGADGPLTKLWT